MSLESALLELDLPARYSLEPNADGSVTVVMAEDPKAEPNLSKNTVRVEPLTQEVVNVEYGSPHKLQELKMVLEDIENRLFNWSAIDRAHLPDQFYTE